MKLAFLILLVLAGACRRADRSIASGNPPVIVISIDTLRSDHLPAYGYSRVATPAIDSLRADSILYEHAYSQAPLTLVSHASLFTGQLPAEHGVRDNIGYSLNPKSTTLAEAMKAKGYATGGAVSALVLRGDTGIKRGFDFWDDDVEMDPNVLSLGRAQRGGDVTREAAQRWISQHKAQPFFFFFHIYEPHTPYEPPEPFRSMYGATYDGDVAAADAIVGRFLDFLRGEGLYDKATIILLSDHGEGLGEHGEQEHGVFLYRASLQVPLLLKLPHATERGKSVPTPVELTDVYPTLADAFHFAHSGAGQSLLAALDGKVDARRPIYSETYYPRLHYGWSDLHSLIEGADHYIQAPRPELYDLASDPGETKNTLQDNRRTYAALKDAIAPFVKGIEAPGKVDPEQARQLAALGYIGSVSSNANAKNLSDPKDHINIAGVFSRGMLAFQSEKYQDAVNIFSGLLKENPDMADAWMAQMRALAKLGRRDEAIEAGKQSLRLSPSSTNLALAVATLALEAGHLDDAEKHARLALKDFPITAHYALAQIALARKDYAGARREVQSSLSSGRDRASGLMLLGDVAKAEGKVDEAIAYYDQALANCKERNRPPIEHLNAAKGDALARLGEGEKAEAALREEIAQYPHNPGPYKNLLLIYIVERRRPDATQLILDLEKNVPTPLGYRAISEVLKSVGDVNGARYWASRGLQRFPGDAMLQSFARG